MSTEQLKIELASAAQLDDIVDMLANDALGKTRERASSDDLQAYILAFDRIKADPNNFLYVAMLGNEVVGTFQLTFIQNMTYKGSMRAQIEAVRIEKGYQNRNLGSEMIQWAIEKSKEAGASMLQLSSNKVRQSAIDFYKKLGFEDSHVGMKLFL